MFPKLFQWGPLTLHTYGLLLALAFLSAISLAARLAERDKISRQRTWDLGFVVVISALLGAKLLMISTDLGRYWSEPSRLISLEFWQAGGVFYGGLLGAFIGSLLFSSRRGDIPFWKIADAAAPAIALGQTVGRLGCFAAGCDYGKPTTVAWAAIFTSEYANRHVGVPLNTPLHPTQLYEALLTLALFAALWVAHGRRRFAGQIFCFYLLFYATGRFGLEYFRGDLDRGFLFDQLLSTSQFVSLLTLAAAVPLYWHLRNRNQLSVLSRDSGKRA